MPELPEVETTVRGLRRAIVGKKIKNIWLDWPKMIKQPTAVVFKNSLKGAKILKIERRAKNILIHLDKDRILLVHQKMTGHFLSGKWQIKKSGVIPVSPKEIKEDPMNRFIHLILIFSDGSMLGFSDMRKFAKVILADKRELLKSKDIAGLGPEPLSLKFSLGDFNNLLSSQKRRIKQVLMDPSVIAGIGNIYADEILFASKVNPHRPANSLTDKERKTMYSAMRKILSKAIKLQGTSFGDYRNVRGRKGNYGKERKVYKKEGHPCPRCSVPIKRVKIGGRSAHFCPRCQPRLDRLGGPISLN